MDRKDIIVAAFMIGMILLVGFLIWESMAGQIAACQADINCTIDQVWTVGYN